MSDCLGNRSSGTGPFGKLDQPLNLMLSESTKNGLLTMAMLVPPHGVTISQYVRDLLDLHVHGGLSVLRTSSVMARQASIARTQQETTE